jgi:RNA polymerase sigma-70 factor, ECF subfamily
VHPRPPLSDRTPNGRNGSEGARLKAAVDGAKAGDSEAIRYLYIRHAAAVHRYVRGIVRDEFEAEDITQAVFTKLFKTIEKYEPRDVPFSAWIRRVARNLALDEMRRRRRAGWGEMERPEAPSDETGSERVRSLHEALRSLPCDQRTVVLLRHMCGLAPSEIAEQLGRSESSIHGLHHRARGALRRALTDLEATPATARPHLKAEAEHGCAA